MGLASAINLDLFPRRIQVPKLRELAVLVRPYPILHKVVASRKQILVISHQALDHTATLKDPTVLPEKYTQVAFTSLG